MDVKVLDAKGNTVKLLISDTNAAFVNALRRKIMSGLPILAVEDVHIHFNNGVMFDEMLAHRLGLMPLKMDSKKYKEGDKIKLILDKEGPCIVHSGDVKSTDPKIEPADLNIPLTKLVEGQKIKLEMDAIVGFGKNHSKWQPALVSFTELPVIKDDKGGKGKSYKADVLEMLVDEKHRDIALSAGQKLEYDPTSFVFVIESFGNLEPKELFESALDELRAKTKEFREEIKNLS